MTTSPTRATPVWPAPVPEPDGLDHEYWAGLQEHELRIQRCSACQRYQWPPEWICRYCGHDSLEWPAVATSGHIYSWQRVWHPPNPSLADVVPYLIVLVSLDVDPAIRLIGNVVGDQQQDLEIGDPVAGRFIDFQSPGQQYSLLHWEIIAA